MAGIDLTEYKRQLELMPHETNDGVWYARSAVHHDGRLYPAGAKLPAMTNAQVVQLLDVNVVTSVAPKQDEEAEQTAADPALDQGGSQLPPSGTSRLDENGNEITE